MDNSFLSRRLRSASATALALLVLAACSSSSSVSPSGSKTPVNTTPKSTVVGSSGGTAISADGNLAIAIPAGALPSNVTITVTAETPPGTGTLGAAYEIGPTGTVFATPITLTFKYGALSLGSTTAGELRVATYANNFWQPLSGWSEDTAGETVSGQTMHLSPYAIVAQSPGLPACVTVGTTAACSVAEDAGAARDAGTGAPQRRPLDCPSAPTCADDAENACGAYPGSTSSGCADDSSGFSTQCCFAPGAQICFAVAIGSACSTASDAGALKDVGVMGQTRPLDCPTAPSCATTNPCEGYPGAMISDCSDSGGTLTASCCYAAGSPVCVEIASADECAIGQSCPQTTCAEAGDPCGSVMGTTMTGCTDSSEGYQVTCCYPVGVIPAPGGSLVGGSTSSDAGVAVDASLPDAGVVDASGGAKDAGGHGDDASP